MRRLSAAFLDLFLLLLMSVTSLWVLSVLLINVKADTVEAPKAVAQFIITSTWDAAENCDVDLWGSRDGILPKVCYYSARELDVFILANDNTSIDYGAVDGVPLDRASETMTIETIKADTYRFSLHGYSIRNIDGHIPVTIKIVKTSPYSVVLEKTIIVYRGEESPVVEFRINSQGEVSDLISDRDLLRKLLE